MSLATPQPQTVPVIADSDAARRLFAELANEPCEVAAIAYLDTSFRLLGMRRIGSLAIDHVPVSLRAIAADILAFDARAVAVAHNHPSGTATPSAADIAATRRLVRVLTPLGVHLIDHLVITPMAITSFRETGLL